MTRKTTIRIIAADIRDGERYSYNDSPVARAVNRALGLDGSSSYSLVTRDEIAVYGPGRGTAARSFDLYALPAAAARWMDDFDVGEPRSSMAALTFQI